MCVCVLAVICLSSNAGVRVCVCVCVVNEADVFALLEQSVVSEGPISTLPEAWLQGPERAASIDEFVSVIKAHSARHTPELDKHTHLSLSFWPLSCARPLAPRPP